MNNAATDLLNDSTLHVRQCSTVRCDSVWHNFNGFLHWHLAPWSAQHSNIAAVNVYDWVSVARVATQLHLIFTEIPADLLGCVLDISFNVFQNLKWFRILFCRCCVCHHFAAFSDNGQSFFINFLIHNIVKRVFLYLYCWQLHLRSMNRESKFFICTLYVCE